MQKIIFFQLLLICIIGFLSFNKTSDLKNKPASIENPLIEVYFTNNLEFDSLVNIRKNLKLKGITLEYKNIQFDDSNKLKAISISVECNDGFKGAASTKKLSSEEKFGIKRDYSGDVPFEIGNLR